MCVIGGTCQPQVGSMGMCSLEARKDHVGLVWMCVCVRACVCVCACVCVFVRVSERAISTQERRNEGNKEKENECAQVMCEKLHTHSQTVRNFVGLINSRCMYIHTLSLLIRCVQA